MKYQVVFSLKNNKINFRMLSATNLLSALRVKCFGKNRFFIILKIQFSH